MLPTWAVMCLQMADISTQVHLNHCTYVLHLGVTIKGVPLTLLDTAGIWDASNVVEQIGIERSGKTALAADIILMVIDASVHNPPNRTNWSFLLCSQSGISKSDLCHEEYVVMHYLLHLFSILLCHQPKWSLH